MSEGDTPRRPEFDTATGRRIVGYDPQTGEPVLESPPRSPQGRLDNRNLIVAIGVGAAVVVLLVVGIVQSSGGGSSGWLPSGAVRGSFQGDLPASVRTRHVYCEWKSGHVEVHVEFHYQGYGEQTQTQIYLPKYVIDGETHGDSSFAEVSHTLHPGWNSETDDAGTPDSTPENEPIQSCIPG
jgi:hypothetical protein